MTYRDVIKNKLKERYGHPKVTKELNDFFTDQIGSFLYVPRDIGPEEAWERAIDDAMLRLARQEKLDKLGIALGLPTQKEFGDAQQHEYRQQQHEYQEKIDNRSYWLSLIAIFISVVALVVSILSD